jgi:hypothetical protein
MTALTHDGSEMTHGMGGSVNRLLNRASVKGLIRRLSAQTDILLFSCDQNIIFSLLCCPGPSANGQ